MHLDGAPKSRAAKIFDIIVAQLDQDPDDISDGSRGFIFNGDPKCIVDFFEIGTRPKLIANR